MTDCNTKSAKDMRSGIDLEAIVTTLGDTRTVNLKQGGTIDIVTAKLTDDVGDIDLALWGDDIKGVKVGSRVKITNGYTNSFKGEVSLTKGKFGQLEIVE